MSPKAADPKIRTALIEAAARSLAEHEPLTIRRLADLVGTSTMAVYTHFGGMDDLVRAVRREGFSRLAQHMAGVSPTRDPVADVSALGWAYVSNAFANPNLYRAMFLEAAIDGEDPDVKAATFLPVIAGVERCIAARRFLPGDSTSMAVQLWTALHGMVTVALAGAISAEELAEHLPAMGLTLYVGFGDDRRVAKRSIDKARRRMSPSFA